MKKTYLSLAFLMFVICASLFLLGCEHEKIKFYRESAASSLINKINAPTKQPVKTSSGMIIIKDENDDSRFNINFGPKDINFDMPARFK